MAKPICPIAQSALSNPVMVYTNQEAEEEEFEIVNAEKETICAERYHIDAIAEHIAVRLVGRVAVLCPNCNQHLDGMRLDIGRVSHDDEEPYNMVSTEPQVLAVAKEIARVFRESNLVDEIPRVQELTIDQMIAIRDRVLRPMIPRQVNRGGQDEECIFNDCIDQAGPIAIVAGVLFGIISVVKYILSPSEPDHGPKKSHNNHGAFVGLDYLNTKI